jgi:hypothetical protein
VTTTQDAGGTQGGQRDDVARFRNLFRTNTGAHYWFDARRLPPRVFGQKTQVPQREVPGAGGEVKLVADIHIATGAEPSAELVGRHLDGDIVLGVAPICDDDMTDWGFIDLDNYWLTTAEVQAAVARLGLPLLVVESKSAAHLLLRCRERVPAELLRRAAAAMVARLPRELAEKHEVFPKQDRLGVKNAKVVWLPYSGARFNAIRPGSKVAGPLDLAGFLAEQEGGGITRQELEEWAARQSKGGGRGAHWAGKRRERAAERHRVAMLRRLADATDNRNDKLNDAALVLGQQVGAGLLGETEAEALLLAAAAACGLLDDSDPAEVAKTHETLARVLEEGRHQPYEPGEGAGQDDDDGRPVVLWYGGSLARTVDEAEEALIERDPDIYQRGDFLVRAAVVPVPAADDRKTVGLRTVTIRHHHLTERLCRAANFKRHDARSGEWLRINPPEQVAMAYLERVGQWRLPVLTAVASAPTLRPDGSVLDTPGYDAATGILYDPGGVEFPPVPAEPTRDDALAALELLREPLAEFPFTGPGSRAVALSMQLTAMVRRSIDHAPLHGASSPTAGSGKSKLVDMASILATGHEAPVLAPGADPEEQEKRLGSSLLAGDAMISFDNCEEPLGNPLLAQALTQTILSIRILGRSENPKVPNVALLCATGINLVLAGDLTRRSLLCSLDPGVERPELRTFRDPLDPVARVRRDRPGLVVAALTLMRAHVLAGRPSPLPPLGGFEQWCRLVREALVWLGEGDPCVTMEDLREVDPAAGDLAAVMAQWEEHIGVHNTATTAKMIQVATERGHYDESRRPEFRDALLSIAGAGQTVNSRRLGRWMLRQQNRILGGRRFVRDGVADGVVRWRLERPERVRVVASTSRHSD